MSKNLNELSLKELTEVYNKHAAKPIKAFSGSKAEAIKRVEAVLPKGKDGGGKAKVGSGAYIRELLVAEKNTPAEIVDKVKAKFPESNCTTKDVAWHKYMMRQDGHKFAK